MIFELHPSKFPQVIPIFQDHKQYLPVYAVVEGNFPGRIFVDHLDSPRTALVWATGRWSFLDGDPLNDAFSANIPGFLLETVIPASLALEMNWFEIYAADTSEWAAVIERALGAFKVGKHYETTYRLDRQAYLKSRQTVALPEGVLLERMDIPILRRPLREIPTIPESFRRRTAVGYCLKRGEQYLAYCRNNGFISGREFMIDVETLVESERNRGHGTAVSTALIDYALEHRLNPWWETTEYNIPSQKLAQKLGFVATESYPVYSIEF